MKKIYHYSLTLSFVGVVMSCQSIPEINHSDSIQKEVFRNMQSQDSVTIAIMPWQEFFKDVYLQNLIQDGIDHNLDLKMGLTRIEAAQAIVSQTKAAFLPDLGIGGSVQRARMSYPQSFGFFNYATLHEVSATSSWEIDVWGKLASAKRSSFYQLLKTEASKNVIQTQLVAQIATYYYHLLVLDQQRIIVERTIENREKDVQMMRHLKEANAVNGASLVRSEANYLEAKVTLPAIKKQIYETENALSILIGRELEIIPRGTLASQNMPTVMKVGVSAQLLQYRPDIRVEELALASYFEDIKVAKRSFYPALTLTASVGYSSYDVKDWFTPTGLFANVTGGLLQPIFNKRQNKTKLALAKVTYQEQVYRFQQRLLQAGKEVSDALYAFEMADQQGKLREEQVEKLALAVDYTKKLMTYNQATNYTDVLTSEQSYLYAELELATNELNKWEALIKLYRSLGGGWM